ncbi:MAG: DUF2510 domain-containing protein [Acidimicrobiia bacterium]|nr:DUF2510 domain-containing protein [Acidimicrobiia bacterium]
MAEAGWYPDPHNPQQQRYWNGTTWTEHIHVPEVPPASTSPPFRPPPSGQPVAAYGNPSQVNDIGDWLRSSFSIAWRKLGTCFLLTLLGLLPLLGVVALVVLALYDLDFGGDQVRGFGGADVALLVAAGLVALGSLVWYGVVTIAQYRVLYDAHQERSIGIGDALAVGRRNVGRLIVAYLIVYGIGAVVVAVVLGVAVALLLAGFSASGAEEMIGRAAPLYNLLNLVSWPLSLWLSVKLAFIPVAAAVAPRDHGLLRTSWRASDGRFWAVLGRILLLSLVVAAVFIPLGLLVAILIAVGALAAESGDVSIGLFVVLGAVFGLVFGVVIYFAQIMQASGVSRLYADLGGPTDQ